METRAFTLTETERRELGALSSDRTVRAQRRARIILGAAEGRDETSIARELGSRPVTIQRALNAFHEKRLGAFSAAARKRATSSTSPSTPDLAALAAQLPMPTAARLVLKHQFSKLERLQAAVRTNADVDAVHDLRVTCRRLNSALRLFRNYLPAKRARKLRRVLEQVRETLGVSRNLDVLLADLDAYRAEAPIQADSQLARVAEAWRAERDLQQLPLLKLLDSEKFRAWGEQMSAFLNSPARAAAPRVADILPAQLWRQYGAVRAFQTRYETAPLQELHTLRIEIKRFRYTLEFFASVFAEQPDALLEPLVTLQDLLGAIQDAVVAGQALATFMRVQARRAKRVGADIPEFQALAAYHAHLHAKIQSLRAQLPERFAIVLDLAFRQQLANLTANL